MAGARLMARRAQRPAPLIAARRLADNPKAGFRAISGLVVALFVTSVTVGIITTMADYRTGPTATAAGQEHGGGQLPEPRQRQPAGRPDARGDAGPAAVDGGGAGRDAGAHQPARDERRGPRPRPGLHVAGRAGLLRPAGPHPGGRPLHRRGPGGVGPGAGHRRVSGQPDVDRVARRRAAGQPSGPAAGHGGRGGHDRCGRGQPGADRAGGLPPVPGRCPRRSPRPTPTTRPTRR